MHTDVSLSMYVILVFAVLFKISNCEEHGTLQYLQILFRHGDRAPIELYPTDPNKNHIWPNGLAGLTQLGKRQHYALGKLLRKTYSNFITTDPLEVDILSSDVDRCLDSVQCNLASFYAPSSKWKFAEDLSWQPLPVKYAPRDKDKYLESDTICPEATKESLRILNSPAGQAIIEENKAMFKNLSFYSGKDIQEWTAASYLHDVLWIEKRYNLTRPHWADFYWNQLTNISSLSFWWNYNSTLLLRLRAGPLLGLMTEKIKDKIAGKLPVSKVQIYSSHDTNVALVLHALGLYNMIPPPYCATLLLELHKINGAFSVRLLYLNSSTPETVFQEPHVLILKGCTEYCPVNFFFQRTAYLIPQDWESECGIQNSFFGGYSKKVITIISIISVILIIIIVSASYVFCKLQQKRNEEHDYSYHLMPDLSS